MDPITAINLAILLLDEGLKIVNQIKGQGGMTADQILAHAESTNAVNKDAIKALLAA